MLTRNIKVIAFNSIVEKAGFLFEENNRQFAFFYQDHNILIYDLYTGANVLKYQDNDLLNLTHDLLIEFARFYISKIAPEQWDEATKKIKTDYPYIDFPVNKKFRL